MIVDLVRWAAEHGGAGTAATRHARGGQLPAPSGTETPSGSTTAPQPTVTP